ncbi:MAG: M28 family peptidase [Candidatus Cyclobacteriaceae bacterium M2_1C_046]
MKKKQHYILLILIILTAGFLLGLSGCEADKREKARKMEEEKEEKIVDVPDFNPDSAYNFIKRQVDYGPRVPNTEGHALTAAYLKEKLNEYGAEVVAQEFTAYTFDGNQVQLQNIIASFYPEKKKRILLGAHWDTRPFADKDPDYKEDPIEGANDGGSGVGVLLEIARILGTAEIKPDVGIDIILFDGEDYGDIEGMDIKDPQDGFYESWWALGSQYWSQRKHDPNYSAFYGILLDMVGARGSTFYQEGVSMEYAPSVVRKVWDRADRLGYGHIFIDKKKPGITDDHLFVNKHAGIPMINIVHYDPKFGYFGDYHHTHKDNMDLISRDILEAVGETVLHTIYYE